LVIAAIGITLVVVGCSRSREGEFEAIKTRVDAHRMQSWAAGILRQYPDATSLFPYFPGIAADSTMVILSNPPPFLQELRMRRMGPAVSVSPTGPSSNRCVSLLYADSFGFGGPGHRIDVGDGTFRETTNAHCIEWIPGVYYCHVHSP